MGATEREIRNAAEVLLTGSYSSQLPSQPSPYHFCTYIFCALNLSEVFCEQTLVMILFFIHSVFHFYFHAVTFQMQVIYTMKISMLV